jgi:isopropylmalate/homocitrate/citramalate synthase
VTKRRHGPAGDGAVNGGPGLFAGPGYRAGKWLVNGIYWNEEAVAARANQPSSIRFIDCTLTEGDDCVGHQLNWNTRLELMSRLDAIGVGAITLPSHAQFEEEVDLARAYRRLGRRTPLAFKGPGLEIPLEGGWRDLMAMVVEKVQPAFLCPVIKIPMSDIFSDFARDLSAESAAHSITEAVAFAKTLGVRVVPWLPEGRLPVARLVQFAKAVAEGGGDGVYLVDSRGNFAPLSTRLLVQAVRQAVPQIEIFVQHHNDLGVATANALAATEGGASWIDAAVLGISERGGCVALEEAAVLLEVYGVDTGIDLTGLYELGQFVQRAFGVALAPWKPILGESWNKEEGWGHLGHPGAAIPGVDDEPAALIGSGVSPEVVGRKYESVIGSKLLFGKERSTANSNAPVFLSQLAESLGFTLAEGDLDVILHRARAAVATTYGRHYLTFEEFRGICEGVVRSHAEEPAAGTHAREGPQ